MNIEQDLNQKLNPYIKERKQMNIEKFNELLKRVNIEDDHEIKHRMLTVIEKYLGSLPVGVAPVEDAEDTAVQPENVKEEIVEMATTPEEAEEVTHEVIEETVVEEKNEEKVEETVEEKTEEVKAEVVEEIPAAEETPVEEAAVVEDTAAEVAEATNEPIAEATVETVEEATTESVSEEPVDVVDKTVDTTEYVESFNLISTTKDEHLSRIVEEGGMIYRDKRSFMMGLWLDRELLALAKTTKLNEMPEHIQKHLKADGFAKVTIVGFGEITKKSRTRSVDVTFKDIEALEHDNALVVEIKDFLENPEKYVDEEEPKSEEKVTVPTTPETKQAAPNQEEVKETAPVSEELVNPQMAATLVIDQRFVKLFEEKKDQIMAQTYGFISNGEECGLFAPSKKGIVKVAKQDKTVLGAVQFKVKIATYTLSTTENGTMGDFLFEILEEKTVQPAPVSQPTEESKEKPAETPVEPKVEEPAEAPVEKAKPETNEEAPRVEDMLNKDYTAEEARQLIEPKANADYKQGYKELVESQSKDMGGAMEEIRNRTAVSPEDRASLMKKGDDHLKALVDKTLAEQGIHTKLEEKKSSVGVATKPAQTTQVVGNLQEGAGNLTQKEMVVKFSVPERFSPEMWEKAVVSGKVLNLTSGLYNKDGMTYKLIKMVGKNDTVVGQAIVSMSDAALIADGKQHTAKLLGIEGAVKVEGKGFRVDLRLGEFKKVA